MPVFASFFLLFRFLSVPHEQAPTVYVRDVSAQTIGHAEVQIRQHISPITVSDAEPTSPKTDPIPPTVWEGSS